MDKDAIDLEDNDKDMEYDEIITGDEDADKTKLVHNKSTVDPLSITEGENNAAITRKKEVSLQMSKDDISNNSFNISKSKTLVSSSTLQNKIVTTNCALGFVKIAPKSTATLAVSTSSTVTTVTSSIASAKTSSGKIIYLQRPGGSSVPVRVPATIATKSSANNSSKPAVAIHVIRTTDGNLVPIKGGKSINISSPSALTGKKVITTPVSGQSGSILIKKAISSETVTAGVATTTVGSTTISSIDKPRVQQIIASKTLIANNNGGMPANSNTIVQNLTGNRQIMVPKGMLKLSPNNPGGQLQTIRIPGKPGIQYVRVLNNTTSVASKIAKPEVTKATTKYTVINQTKPAVKIMIKSPTSAEKKIINTVPTLRKINEPASKLNETGEGGTIRSTNTSIVGSQSQRIRISNEEKDDVSADEYVVTTNKPSIRYMMTNQHQKSIQERNISIEIQKAPTQSLPSAKKLYTVLKPDTTYKDVKLKSKSEAVPTKQGSSNLTNASIGNSIRSSPLPADESTVTIRRKHCNCTKSQCLKLYCDCFANGEFCQDCNCKDCLNNLSNEDERQKAIRICLERNPNSFKPKITVATNESDQRLHNKGCNCKRSGCLKNYCECYEAKIPCSSNCKCIGCRNVEDHPDLDMDIKKGPISAVQTFGRIKRTYDDMMKSKAPPLPSSVSSAIPGLISTTSVTAATIPICGPTSEKQPCNFITQEVVDATIQCLIAQADECKKGGLTPYQTEKMIMEELGRCLVEIIDFSIRNTDQN